jgi:carboxyl-terminal processing protease
MIFSTGVDTMKNKRSIIFLSIFTGIISLLTVAGGCVPDLFNPPSKTTSQTSGLNIDLIKEAYDIIGSQYVEPAKIDATDLTQGAIKGMVDGLQDPHSAYLTPEQYQLTMSDFEGKFDGVGAYVGLDTTTGRIQVIAPIPDTPAEKAGIKAGDLILEVDGKSTENMTTTDVVLLIRGPKGTSVKLTVLHKGETTPVTITITRAEIKVPAVRFEMKGDYAYINIVHFTEKTDDELIPVLKTIEKNNAKGIILDLRHNPGGILQTVVDIASHFVTQGPVVYVVDREGNKDTMSAGRFAYKIDLPMVTLVDEFSASGSEVLAGALQDYQRSKVAGTRTYGKGSVNQLHQLSDDSGIYITIARWLTPNGHLIEGKGITPDIEVDWQSVDGIEWAINYLNNLK